MIISGGKEENCKKFTKHEVSGKINSHINLLTRKARGNLKIKIVIFK